MKNPGTIKPTAHSLGWIVVGVGILLFITGIALRTFQPGTIADTRLLEGFGLLLAGWGIIPVVRSLSARRNPTAARRTELAEKDERAAAIRNQAAYAAFLFTMAVSSFVLLIYSAFTRGQTGFDPIWFAFAMLVIAPALVYVGMMVWLNRQ
jgi:hypothetical protein